MKQPHFTDRRQAGHTLAKALEALQTAERAFPDPVVIALPRGGVPVGLEVARALKAPLDLVLVRKIGAPEHPELAAAAVVDGSEAGLVVNRDVIATTGMSEAQLMAARDVQLAEIERRRDLYLAGRERVAIDGRDVIVVDDGVATGATTRAALVALQGRRPKSLTLAVPVGPRDVLSRLEREVDRIVCLLTPSPFVAIGLYYDDFAQIQDREVARLLAELDRPPV